MAGGSGCATPSSLVLSHVSLTRGPTSTSLGGPGTTSGSKTSVAEDPIAYISIISDISAGSTLGLTSTMSMIATSAALTDSPTKTAISPLASITTSTMAGCTE
ncbi:hypothetical protein Nepgr_031597 [Nepenthes gracilis]|uniref:Uncharacterized protein n=1 Tax=Nepenthes gracilis TaxID=150966 RepID=A0AAD3TIG4_NEPGR|nr:hypothetical protein Nepgr_031597 [Nepenthes gracilis]